eukprot:1048240-Prymnesium_polylepis.1
MDGVRSATVQLSAGFCSGGETTSVSVSACRGRCRRKRRRCYQARTPAAGPPGSWRGSMGRARKLCC